MSDLEATIANAEEKLKNLDPLLGEIIVAQQPIIREPQTDYFYFLVRAIVSQQVSVAAAKSIFNKLKTATDLNCAFMASMPDQAYRECGISRQKAGYMRDLAQHFVDDPKVFNHLNKLSDEEVIKELTGVKGIGVWTAQIFLMAALVRLDIFAPDDIGLQRAIKKLYGWSEVTPKSELEQIAARWQPYRSVACWHLWESLSNDPT